MRRGLGRHPPIDKPRDRPRDQRHDQDQSKIGHGERLVHLRKNKGADGKKDHERCDRAGSHVRKRSRRVKPLARKERERRCDPAADKRERKPRDGQPKPELRQKPPLWKALRQDE